MNRGQTKVHNQQEFEPTGHSDSGHIHKQLPDRLTIGAQVVQNIQKAVCPWEHKALQCDQDNHNLCTLLAFA